MVSGRFQDEDSVREYEWTSKGAAILHGLWSGGAIRVPNALREIVERVLDVPPAMARPIAMPRKPR
jgi:hypothetical protein